MNRRTGRPLRLQPSDLVRRFDRLIATLPTDEAVATVAHYALGIRYVKIASYLKVSPRKAQRLAAAGMRTMRDGVRRQNLHSDDSAAIWDFTGTELNDCEFVRWLAEQFQADFIWTPYTLWIIEFVSGIETRPCRMCGEPIYRSTAEGPELGSLAAELGRPRKYCSNACRQQWHYWKRYRRTPDDS